MEAEFEIGAIPPINDADFECFWERFLQESKEAAGSRSATRDHPRKAILDGYGECFATMDLLHESAREAINWASATVHESLSDSSDDDAFADYINVVVGLGGRALLAFDEVTWLLRGGYPHGAMTRMRTIHEVFVVAATLGLHGYPEGDHPELVERYQRHHEVFTATVAEDLIAAGGAQMEETLNEDVLGALERKRQDLIGVYGKKFGSAWGWAAPLFPASKNPSFTALSKLIPPDFNAFYGIASSQLHASSQGLIEAERLTESGEKHYFAGAQADGLAVPAILGSGFLVGILGAIVPTSITAPDSADLNTDGRYFLGALARLQEQIRIGMENVAPQREG